ncbi:hypothetical protein QQP08_006643 [Theobroma cacao]|nr:hypothetical protein QQP08_006643 [Theobroma cacao]
MNFFYKVLKEVKTFTRYIYIQSNFHGCSLTIILCKSGQRALYIVMAPFSMRGRLHNNHKMPIAKKRLQSQTKTRKSGMKGMQERFKRLKTEMEEISEEQKGIREGQRQVREKFEAIESECEQLKKETKFIIQQSARTQIKLVLMFKILKAREESDFSTAANLTQWLGQIVAREKEERQALSDA